MKRARIPNIPLQGLGRELGRNGRVTESVNIDNVLRNVPVHSLVAFIQYDEKEVETRHDRGAHSHVRTQRLFAIVPTADGIGSGENRRACIQGGLNAGLGDRDSLLLHGLVDRDLIGEVHLVKLVNGANTIVCEHKSAGLDRKFTCFFVTDDSGRETCRRGRLARRIYGARHETTHILKELRFARAGIAHDAYVDIAT